MSQSNGTINGNQIEVSRFVKTELALSTQAEADPPSKLESATKRNHCLTEVHSVVSLIADLFIGRSRPISHRTLRWCNAKHGLALA